jgi:hypothetical protein
MTSGVHVVIYSTNAEADRAFLRDVIGFKSVDAGHGWLIFALPQQKPHYIRQIRMAPTNSISCAMI